MRKFIVNAAVACAALFGCIITTACTESVDDLLIEQGRAIRSYDFEKVRKTSKKLCKKNNSLGCYMYGGLLAKDNDFGQALTFLEKSCKLNHRGACAEVGIYYLNGVGGMATDTTKANQYFKEACQLNENWIDGDTRMNIAVACYFTGTQYKVGSNVPVDNETASRYFSKACSLGLRQACEM